jgi:penicillin-insensitive murein endopeptidase
VALPALRLALWFTSASGQNQLDASLDEIFTLTADSSIMRWLSLALTVLTLTLVTGGAALSQTTAEEEAERRARVLRDLPDWAAKVQFGRHQQPAGSLQARAIGSYARGCLAGAVALPVEGETWQVMRQNRNRNWGHPDLIAYLEVLAKAAPRVANWPGILVGDISQPRGGPMLTGHASHQIGLDADIWLTPMPRQKLNRDQRENMPATNMVRPDWMDVNTEVWTQGHLRLIRHSARDARVHRIFVNPAIKRALCRDAGQDRDWLAKVRPMWGHNFHFHIRMACPPGMAGCVDQDPPPDGDGCGTELSDWLEKQRQAFATPRQPTTRPQRPPPPMSVDALPAECRQVLVAR